VYYNRSHRPALDAALWPAL
jgi:hypothetical protein